MPDFYRFLKGKYTKHVPTYAIRWAVLQIILQVYYDTRFE